MGLGMPARTILIAVLATISVLAATVLLTRPLAIHARSPSANGAVPAARSHVLVDVGWAVGEARVRIDGRDVSARMQRAGGRVRIPGLRLGEGRHRVEVAADSRIPLVGGRSRSWTFAVDSAAPALNRATVRRTVRATRVRLHGRTEPGSMLTAELRSERAGRDQAGPDGRYSIPLRVTEGGNPVRLRAVDAAGNASTVSGSIVRDTVAPVIAIEGWRGRRREKAPTLRGTVGAEPSALVSITVDGAPATAAPAKAVAGRFRATLRPLTEGTHVLEIRARDRAGNAATERRRLLVDSTERLGSATLGRGARGADARSLLRLLRRYGGYDGPVGSRIGDEAIAAVRRFQRRRGLAVDGLVGPDVRSTLLGKLPARVQIDLSARSLTLFRGRTAAKSWPVAVGQPAYPSPTGSFRVVDKQIDPVWTPPDSPWAAELDTIPAGPGNPLGTRWIGTSRSAIGIHGTYAEASIGTAASHGCIRMRIADVEELFRQVRIGTPIAIRR